MTKQTTFESDLLMHQACLLQVRAERNVRALISSELHARHLTMMEWLLLGVLYDAPSSSTSMSTLADSLKVTMPQVTALVAKLMPLKLVRQKSSRRDRRLRCIQITGKGRNTIEELEETVRERARLWLQPIEPDKMRSYVETLRQLCELSPGVVEPDTEAQSTNLSVSSGPRAITVE